jgi:hypothetical protein
MDGRLESAGRRETATTGRRKKFTPNMLRQTEDLFGSMQRDDAALSVAVSGSDFFSDAHPT